MNQDKAKFKTFREIMQTRFPEEDQVQRIKRPDAIRLTLDEFRCDVPLAEIKDEGDLLSWIDYLGSKKGMTLPALVRFIKLVSEAKQFQLFR